MNPEVMCSFVEPSKHFFSLGLYFK